MVLPLVRRLGLRATVAVISALGTLRDEASAGQAVPPGKPFGLTRKKFLQLGAGAVIAGTIVATGQVPAYASNPARAWANSNKAKPPTTYDEFSTYPPDYRREIYQKLQPAKRSEFWTEQLQRYQSSHANLSALQREILGDALRIASDPAVFDPTTSQNSATEVQSLGIRAREAFGTSEAANLFATLGPPSPTSKSLAAAGCGCSILDDYCGAFLNCNPSECSYSPSGCGTFLQYPCNGDCGW
ncbi:bacteriocin fulvocin C-related protein [Pseudonocardia nigra]|uniref:bacteriocin fulvocin C-related protein n=1 Tax=Pseudonocardia nigra TaxID=1921578 RepID=UPI0035580358